MSTEYRIGMGEGRNSSRVLKPPGGGHSQIFGAADEEAPRKHHQKTEISGCFGTESGTKPVAKADVPEKVDAPEKAQDENNANGNNATTNGTNGNGYGEQMKNDINEDKKIDIIEAKGEGTPQKKRVPPGGFSSGAFW